MISKIRNMMIFAILALAVTSVSADINFAAIEDGCPNNLTLMPAGMEVIYSPQMFVGQVSNGQVDEGVINYMHSYFFNYFQQNLPTSSLLAGLPTDINILQENAPTPMVLTGNYHCLTSGVTAIFREAQTDSQIGWVIETLMMPDIELTEEVIEQFTLELIDPLQQVPENNDSLGYATPFVMGQLQLEAPDEAQQPPNILANPTMPILSGMKFNFWRLDVNVPITPFDSPDSLFAPENSPQDLCGEYSAPSYLSVGMQAEMDGYQYAHFPISGDLTDLSNSNWLDLGAKTSESIYAITYFADMLQTTDLVAQPLDSDELGNNNNPAIIASAETLFAPPVYGAPIVTIMNGPYCGHQEIVDNHPCPENGVCEWTAPVFDRYATWWQIEVSVHGETYVGWYPENLTQYAWWLWDTQGYFDQAATAYLLTPIAVAMTTTAICEVLPTSRFATGMDVQPAVGAMNIRDTANGSIIGRVETAERMTLIGEPICEEGTRWREVNFHSGSIGRGWIAENDISTFYITTYRAPVETREPETSQPSNDHAEQVTPQFEPTQVAPDPTQVAPDPEPTRPPRFTVEIRPTCTSSTNQGC